MKVELKPFTVLIGPNDSGKSVFLQAIQRAICAIQLDRTDCWRRDNDVKATVRLTTDGGNFHTSNKSAPLVGGRAAEYRQARIIRPPASGVVLRGKGYPDAALPPELDETGAFVPALLDYMLRRDRARFDEFVAAVKHRVEGLVDIHVGTPDPASRSVDVKLDGNLVLPHEDLSVGFRLLILYLALAFHPQPPPVLLIEEPENGLHPRRLGDVVALLRDITKGVHCGNAAQVILTTHSPYLLDHVNLDEDQVLVFRREPDGARTCAPIDKERLRTFLDEFMLGEVWFNQEEPGLVARQP